MAEERCEQHQYQTLDSQGECPICKQDMLLTAKDSVDKTKLHEWGSSPSLPRGWRGRILRSKS